MGSAGAKGHPHCHQDKYAPAVLSNFVITAWDSNPREKMSHWPIRRGNGHYKRSVQKGARKGLAKHGEDMLSSDKFLSRQRETGSEAWLGWDGTKKMGRENTEK